MANPAEAVQIWSGKNRIERLRHEYTRKGGGGGGCRGHQHAPREILLLLNAHFAYSQKELAKK